MWHTTRVSTKKTRRALRVIDDDRAAACLNDSWTRTAPAGADENGAGPWRGVPVGPEQIDAPYIWPEFNTIKRKLRIVIFVFFCLFQHGIAGHVEIFQKTFAKKNPSST